MNQKPENKIAESRKHKGKTTEQLKTELDNIQAEIDKYTPAQAKTHALKLLKKEKGSISRRLSQIRKEEKLLNENPQEGVIAPISIKAKREMSLLTEEEYKAYKQGKGKPIPATWAAQSQSIIAWKQFDKVIEKCSSKKQIMAIVAKYLEIVERGDSWAMVDFLNRWFGKPTEKQEITIDSINMNPQQKIAEINVILGLTTPPEVKYPPIEDTEKQNIIIVKPEENKDADPK